MEKNRNRGNHPSPKNHSSEGAFRKKKRHKDHFRGKAFHKAEGSLTANTQGDPGEDDSQEALLGGGFQDRRPRSSGQRQGSRPSEKPSHPRQHQGRDHRNQSSDDPRRERSRRPGKAPPSKSVPSRHKDGGVKKHPETPPESRLKIQAALEAEEKAFKHVSRKYDVMIFDTLALAHQELDEIRERARVVDQLNVVIRAESSMDDPLLTEIPQVKVFAGAAWTLIHERRIQDGWYQSPQ